MSDSRRRRRRNAVSRVVDKHQTKAFKKGRSKHHWSLWVITGIAICLGGSTLATAHFACFSNVPLFVLDGAAYFIHGVGAIPLLKGIEPLWALICDL